MAKRFHEEYAGVDQRRMMEKKDSEMIGDGRSSFANLPQEIVMKAYPRSPMGMPDGMLDDTLRGVDMQIGMDHGKFRGQFAPKKI